MSFMLCSLHNHSFFQIIILCLIILSLIFMLQNFLKHMVQLVLQFYLRKKQRKAIESSVCV